MGPQDEVAAKLDQLIRIMAIQLVNDLESSKEKILMLGRTGLAPKDIADILQTTPNHVNVTLSKARKADRSKPTEE